ncbi:hypothetical protein [Leuconostoc phage P974]|jgi:hypothetical protein|nr:hypothetical protein [Leuconostoc phage P974]UPW35794.1 hypothetical protein [Liquorilactobacillus phage UCMA21115]
MKQLFKLVGGLLVGKYKLVEWTRSNVNNNRSFGFTVISK